MAILQLSNLVGDAVGRVYSSGYGLRELFQEKARI